MATSTATQGGAHEATLAESPEDKLQPNVRPHGLERVPDPKWRDWRLRERRPEDKETMLPTFPCINDHIRQEASKEIQDYVNKAVVRAAEPTLFTRRRIEDLPRGYRPVQLAFRPLQEVEDEFNRQRFLSQPRKMHRDEDTDRLPCAWFEEMSSSLFARVWEFSSETFGWQCFGDRVHEADWTSLWLRKLPDEIVRCASLVARGDPVIGPKPHDPNSYEHLFLARHSRVLLFIGIIGKLLEENVLGSLLFGANEKQEAALKLIDETTENDTDGFYRNFTRQNAVDGYLEDDLFTENFWEEVGRVTMGILDLLLPMINLLGHEVPTAPWPALTDVHQKLHDIVAEAAWLTNGVRHSRSCYWIEFPQPGQTWDLRQSHTTEVIWKASNAAAKALDAAANDATPEMAAWTAQRDRAFRAARLPDEQKAAWTAETFERAHPRPWGAGVTRRTAKVQIAMWPFVKRYFPVRQSTARSGRVNDGEERVNITNAQVVYYAGDDANEADADAREGLTLARHLQQWRRRHRRAERAWTLSFVAAALVVCLLLVGIVSLAGLGPNAIRDLAPPRPPLPWFRAPRVTVSGIETDVLTAHLTPSPTPTIAIGVEGIIEPETMVTVASSTEAGEL